MYKIIEANEELVLRFLKVAGQSLGTFRYFSKRPVSIIEEHNFTIVLMKDDITVGYGHLEKEDGRVWLGICIADFETGKGCGKILMECLVDFALNNNMKAIYLTVDAVNLSAIRLYEKYFFEVQEFISVDILLMKRVLRE